MNRSRTAGADASIFYRFNVCRNRMGQDLGVEFIAQNDHVLKRSSAVFSMGFRSYQIWASRRKLNRQRWTMRALPRTESVPKKIVAPKMRSNAATNRRYSLPVLVKIF